MALALSVTDRSNLPLLVILGVCAFGLLVLALRELWVSLPFLRKRWRRRRDARAAARHVDLSAQGLDTGFDPRGCGADDRALVEWSVSGV